MNNTQNTPPHPPGRHPGKPAFAFCYGHTPPARPHPTWQKMTQSPLNDSTLTPRYPTIPIDPWLVVIEEIN